MKHNSETCKVPFCKECYKIFRANIGGILNIARKLSAPPSTSITKEGKR